MRFDRDPANIDHIARYKIGPREAEMVRDTAAPPFAAHRGPHGQLRFGVLGAAEDGRVLVIVEERQDQLRVGTARLATEAERAQYLQEE